VFTTIIAPKMRALSSHLTRRIARRYGDHMPLWYVTEYPKAGGTWLSHMVGHYLAIPFPQHSLFPITFKAVVQNHWKYTPDLKRNFYLVRDGRDSMVSFYFMRMNDIRRQRDVADARFKRTYDRLFGPGYDPNDVRRHLPKFIEHEMEHPRGSRLSWTQHVEQWWDPDHPERACLKYEELLQDGVGTLARCFEKLTGEPADRERLAYTVERFSFENMTGRKRGQADNAAFLRKGIAGDWVNHFSPEAEQVFMHYAGSTLRQLGYDQINTMAKDARDPKSQPVSGVADPRQALESAEPATSTDP
jgi:hypothetical protein